MLGVLLFWTACGVVAAMIGSANGRSGCGFLLLGFILGPIGVAIALITGRSDASMTGQALARGDLRRCDRCQEVVQLGATVCRHCGREWSLAAVRAAVDRRANERGRNAVFVFVLILLVIGLGLATR